MNRLNDLFKSLPNEIDCAFITSDINRFYFTGMKSSAGYVLAFKEKSYLLIDFRYYEKAQQLVKSCEVILLKDFKKQANDLFFKHNVKSIAIESFTLTVSQLSDYKKIFKDYNIDSSDKLSQGINDLRIIKSQDEIAKIRNAQQIAEKAFDNVLNHIKVGKTEKEIALALDFFMLENGADALSFDTIVLTGTNTSLPHGVPSQAVMKQNDFILMDYGAVYEGYHSDMTRTICIGTPTDEMCLVYDTVLKAQTTALENAKAGIMGFELDKLARDVIIKAGYGDNFGHSLGHGVGLEIHEYPNASPLSKTVLKSNMIITIEPGIYLPDKFGVRIEDFVIITDESCENITNCAKKLICV